MNLNKSRKDLNEIYGTWFPQDPTIEQLINRVEDQMAKCKAWMENLTELLEDAKKEQQREQAKLLAENLKVMDAESKRKLLEGLDTDSLRELLRQREDAA